ncbi:hypothetical protein DPMN_041026 [Dreissena polymorpha]|uniref:Uncharacterized protein n=1 Tax=Dreissena polymorpha TaxID=45954 RepID=A0A9D4HVL5_DREPO|nr:hypothetical protein DPMN_041026 [Dreissena polymorpha]
MARQRPTRLVMGPCIVEICRIVIRDVQYQLEVNRCRNEEVNFQCSSAYSVSSAYSTDGQTDGQTAEITTISRRFSKSVIIAEDHYILAARHDVQKPRMPETLLQNALEDLSVAPHRSDK